MPREMTEMVKALTLVLYIAAARVAATNDQVIALRRDLVPVMESYRQHDIDEEGVMDWVDRVMGGGWEIPQDFSDQLAALGFTRGELGK